MKIKKVVSVVLLVVSSFVLFLGCGNKDKKETGENVSLRFIDVSPSPARQSYFENTFEKFKEETGITVAYESVPWDDAANKITVLGGSGQLPDVLTLHPFWLGQLTSADWILPLDDYVEKNKDKYTLTVQKFEWDSQMQKYGHVYTVPDGYMAKGVFYRKDWVEEIGYEIPTGEDWTFKEYFKLVEALTDKEKKRYGTSFRGARGGFDIAKVYMQTFNGGQTYAEDGTCLFNTPESIKAFEEWCSMYTEGYAPEDSVNWGFVELVDNFTGGLTGTLINDSEVAVACQENMEDDQWGVLPFPRSDVDGKNYNLVGSTYGYGASTQSKHPEESLKLIEFLSRPDNNIEYCKIAGQIPVRVEVGDDKLYGEDGPYAVFVSQLNDENLVKPAEYGPFDYTDLHQDMLHSEMQKYLLGKQTAKEALDTISNELTLRMKDYLEKNEGSEVEKPLSVK